MASVMDNEHTPHELYPEVAKFLADTGLSEHRVGMVLANNGRLVERLRAGKRFLSDTERTILANIEVQRAKRLLPENKTGEA